jgi:nitrate reductase / nitrite oxidoreductase, beta subunit
MASPEDKESRVNLLNWDGKGTPEGLFPPPAEASPEASEEGERR